MVMFTDSSSLMVKLILPSSSRVPSLPFLTKDIMDGASFTEARTKVKFCFVTLPSLSVTLIITREVPTKFFLGVKVRFAVVLSNLTMAADVVFS